MKLQESRGNTDTSLIALCLKSTPLPESGVRRYCHILNPGTGMPVNCWQSVTILAATALLAGSRSTITMLKEKEGLDYLARTGMKYLEVDSTGAIHHRN